MGAAREHDLIDALGTPGIRVLAESAYRGARANVEVPQRPHARAGGLDNRPHTSANQEAVNAAHARLRGPAERANAQLKTWKSFAGSEHVPTTQPCSSTLYRPSSKQAEPKWKRLSPAPAEIRARKPEGLAFLTLVEGDRRWRVEAADRGGPKPDHPGWRARSVRRGEPT